MSSLITSPAVVSCYGTNDKIGIVTLNIQTLSPMYELIQRYYKIDLTSSQFTLIEVSDIAQLKEGKKTHST